MFFKDLNRDLIRKECWSDFLSKKTTFPRHRSGCQAGARNPLYTALCINTAQFYPKTVQSHNWSKTSCTECIALYWSLHSPLLDETNNLVDRLAAELRTRACVSKHPKVLQLKGDGAMKSFSQLTKTKRSLRMHPPTWIV